MKRAICYEKSRSETDKWPLHTFVVCDAPEQFIFEVSGTVVCYVTRPDLPQNLLLHYRYDLAELLPISQFVG